MHIEIPFAIKRRLVADVDINRYVESLIEQVLFISKGERVNRPEFGCGVARLVFSPMNSPSAAAIQHMIQSELQRFVSDVADIQSVTTDTGENDIRITVVYYNKLAQAVQESTYVQPIP